MRPTTISRFLDSTILKAWKERACILLAPLLLLPLPLHYRTQESKCGYVVLLMAFYWMTKAIPLPITGLLPIILLPTLGVIDTTEVCSAYMNEAIMIGIGSIFVAIAVEECNLHQRIALLVLIKVGTTPKRLLIGFMISSMLISMWIGPTPVMAMMMPIVKSVLEQLTMLKTKQNTEMESKSHNSDPYQIESSDEKKCVLNSEEEDAENKLLQRILLLGLCFSTNIGGTGTIPATAPNLVFKRVMESFFPDYNGMTFTSWMFFNFPGMLINAALIWIYLTLIYVRKIKSQNDRSTIKTFLTQKYSELGRITFHEATVLVLFIILAILWLFREPEFMNGWGKIMPGPARVTDATSTLAVAALLFIIPSKPSLRLVSSPLLEWKIAQDKMPWGVLILLGGGFALAEGAKKSGFSDWLSRSLSVLNILSRPVLCLILCLVILVLIEISGNTATATIVFPVLARMAAIQQIHPLYIMLPAAVCSSFAFIFPVSSAPNAIIFESFAIKVREMVIPGLIAKVICLSVTFMMINTLGSAMFKLDTYPQWANNSLTNF